MSGTYQHKEGAGSMLANNKTSDAQPDWRGDFMLNGTLYEIAGWAGSTQGASKPRVDRRRPGDGRGFGGACKRVHVAHPMEW